MPRKDDERTPAEWREILRNFDYPDEVSSGPRRGRAGRKRAHREDVRRRTKEWVKEERRREPIRPVGALIIVALIIGIGLGSRFLWPDLLGAEKQGTKATATAPADPAAPDNKPSGTPSSSSAPSPSASPAVDLSKAETVAEQMVRLYLTRNPPADGKHGASVLRAAPYMTPALVENLGSSSDPAWDKLVSRGGVSTVGAVKVGPADSGLPGDSPLRVWRKVEATVSVEGYTKYTEQTVLQVELTNSTGTAWRVSRILGL
ncbi:hypothetical protein [Streptomyces sp. NPDC051546]|uniref:hypothetical protein n=1 Tax=Streptomyces sp. NPDC051546 TaxID=3365655 RepID=UPI0037A9C536